MHSIKFYMLQVLMPWSLLTMLKFQYVVYKVPAVSYLSMYFIMIITKIIKVAELFNFGIKIFINQFYCIFRRLIVS